MQKWRDKIKDFLTVCRSPEEFRQLDDPVLPFAAWAAGGGAPLLLLAPTAGKAEVLAGGIGLLGEGLGARRKVAVLPELPAGKLLTLEQESEFLGVLFGVLVSPPDYLIASAGSLLEPAPPPDELLRSRVELRRGGGLPFPELLEKLVALGYDDEFEVVSPGEFSRRGGIIDVFSPACDFPVRLEFWGDELTDIRRFSTDTQKSEGKVDGYLIIARSLPERGGDTVADYARKLKMQPVLVHPEECYEQLRNFFSEDRLPRFLEAWRKLPHRMEWGDAAAAVPADRPRFGCFPAVAHLMRLLPEEIAGNSLELVRGQIASQIEQWLATSYTVLIGGRDETAREHIERWKQIYGFQEDKTAGKLITVDWVLPSGVIFPSLNLVFLNEKELFAVNLKAGVREEDVELAVAPSPRRKLSFDSAEIVADLNEGDCAVHLNYGIGIFRGIRVLAGKSSRREVMVLEYAEDKLLYVPLHQAHLVSRYMGSAGRAPLHRLNSRKWGNDRAGALRSVREYAADLLRMQAVRHSVPNLPLAPENYEQAAFEHGCDFELTRDQKRAAAEIKADLASDHPMDRLLCGDVGFGKTEVAMQAAFRMVYAGYQVAVLAPTTVLAQQHFYSFRERFAEYAVVIDMVSRFRSAAEQKQVLRLAAEGKIDILIGTHRLCQDDVKFANLGLLVVDEEQRFGVRHKELLRRLRTSVNVLSMSATPIPRTLYLAMAGARDLSTIMTAPVARLPVRTVICEERDQAWLGTVNLELARGGQVYYLHNRVKSIESRAGQLRELFPKARLAVAHGQMDEEALEKVMAEFLSGRVDILVCTTIVESGLDVPNANTIVIDRADRFGLAELYQLRGRVGRARRQAYCCLLLPRSELITLDGRKRIAAIRRYSHLGAGFQLALRDLEIRGSGNLLGEEQSGYVRVIGFELYCQLLSGEIRRLKGEKVEFLPEVDLALDFVMFAWEAPENLLPASLPPAYIESERLRVEAYRKLSRAGSEEELRALRGEFADRYGKLPVPAENMFKITLLRILAARKNYVGVSVGDGMVLFRSQSGSPFRIDGRIPTLSGALPPARKIARVLELARML